MKITVNQLRQIIKEEVQKIYETADPVELAISKYKTSPLQWDMAVDDFYEMAEGDDRDGIRQKYYAGWRDEDFQRVIDAVEGHRTSAYEPLRGQ